VSTVTSVTQDMIAQRTLVGFLKTGSVFVCMMGPRPKPSKHPIF
jgi:hypothetical protein